MTTLIHLIIQYKYYIIFPLSIPEGPILTVICGFLVSLGFLNPIAVYVLVVIGDAMGDSLVYALGRWGGHRVLTSPVGRFLGITDEKIEKARVFYHRHHDKTVFLSKIIHGVGPAGLFTGGALKIPYGRYFQVCLLTTLAQSAVLLVIGIVFGSAYVTINQYLNIYAAVALIVAGIAALYFVIKRFLFPRIDFSITHDKDSSSEI
jgi:membrane protein DedA with SNARE-associated domain